MSIVRAVIPAIASACMLTPGVAAATPNHMGATRPADWAASSTAAPSTRGVTYGGSTSADDPVVLVLSRHGRTLKRAIMQVDATCAGGHRPYAYFVDAPANVTVRADGRFAGVLKSSGRLGDGETTQDAITLEGRVSGRTLSGSASYRADVRDASGAIVDTCEQQVMLKARSARRKVFGGRTSQGAPVVITVRRTVVAREDELRVAREVREFRIGWAAPCTPAGAFVVGDTLIDFPIRAGRFGDDWTWTPEQADGGTDAFVYSLHGKLDRAAVSGTFSLSWSGVSTAGAQTSCDTGPLTYEATSG